MRVDLLTREYPPHVYGGAGVHVLELAKVLRGLVDDLRVQAFDGPREPGTDGADPGVTGHSDLPQLEGANAALRTLGVDLEIAAACEGSDLVHSHTWYANFAGHVASLLGDIPHVISAHSLEPLRPWKAEQLGGGYRLSSYVEKTAYEAASAIVAVSNGMRDDILRCYPSVDPERVHVIHNGIDLNKWHAPEGEAGDELRARVLAEAGFAHVSLVAAQAEPDPDFPTVPFPNPEEAGALDMAIEQARAEDADLIIAVDPDADRCALAVPDPRAEAGWTPLSGDQIGCLLGEFLASRGLTGSLANSIVSSRLLARIAHAHGLEHHTTLTGFKWIARAPQLAFGYEEAIGFCPNPSVARDKDGIATSVVAASLFAALKAEGRTAWDELDRLAHAHGLHVTGPLTFRVEEIEQIATGMARLRAQPPSVLAGSPVVEVSDLAEGYRGLPPTDGVLVLTKAGDRVIARPSGTEPKLKCYLEVILPAPEGEPVPWDEAYERLERIKREFGQIIGL